MDDLTTPQMMSIDDEEEQIEYIFEQIEHEFIKLPKGDAAYHIIVDGIYHEKIKQKICDAYKKAGWKTVEYSKVPLDYKPFFKSHHYDYDNSTKFKFWR